MCIFFFKVTAPTEIYTLSLHDALPISLRAGQSAAKQQRCAAERRDWDRDRKSTRLNSSHVEISYAVFCLKKKKHALLTPCQLLRPHAALLVCTLDHLLPLLDPARILRC